MKNLSLIATLDANKPEVFLNPFKILDITEYPRESTVSIIFNFDGDAQDLTDEILVNGAPLEIGKTYTIAGNDIEDYYFLVYMQHLIDLSLDFTFIFNSSELENINGKLFAKKNLENVSNIFDKNVVALTDTNSSFQMIRTNPKLSGNIKLVVGADQTLYLDTFKVSENLNKFAYRHKVVSAESNYNTDVRNIFQSLDSQDLYKVPDVDLKSHAIYTDFEVQYDTTYEYGVETNNDELYNENFKLLAPLWINKNLPDFFAVFRIDDVCNIDSYKTKIDDTDAFKKLLREGKMIKAFDMRISSPLGKYLRNYYNLISEYPGSVLLQFKEQETNNKYNNGINSWIGISVDTGLITKKDEMSYFANERIEGGSQEYLNQFIVEGFERNRLLCPNIINLEFMFDDPDSENFSMHRYFGLYLKENDFITYDFVEQAIDENTKNYAIKKFDSQYKEVDDEIVSGTDSILEKEEYKEKLFFGVSPLVAERLTDKIEFKNFIRNNVTNQSYKNYKICPSRIVEAKKKHFITLKFKKQISYGEHFRITIPNFSAYGLDNPVIFEIIASNDNRLASVENCISPYLNITNSINDLNNYIYYREIKNKPVGDEYYKVSDETRQSFYFRNRRGETYSQFPIIDIVRYQNRYGAVNKLRFNEWEVKKMPYFFRLNFFTQTEFDFDVTAGLATQLKRFKACLDALQNDFGFDINVEKVSEDSISITTDYDNVFFQHITNDILDIDTVEIKSVKTDLYADNPDGFSPKFFETCFGDLYYDDVQNKDEADETILYFGRDDLDIKLFALDNKTNTYDADSLIFAPINFEVLGWRKTSVVRFADFGKYNYELVVDDLAKIRVNTLVNTATQFVRIKDFNIVSAGLNHPSYLQKIENETDYAELYDRLKVKFDELKSVVEEQYVSDKYSQELQDLKFYEQEMIEIESYKDGLWRYREEYTDTYNRVYEIPVRTNMVQSPYDLNMFLISSDTPLVMQRDGMSLYSSKPFSIALMGMLPIKDFDSVVGYSEKQTIDNNVSLIIPKKTSVYIDDKSKEYELKSGVYYLMEQGKFKNTSLVQGTAFIILNDVIYYNSGNSGNTVLSKKLNGGCLETTASNTLVKISQISPAIASKYDIVGVELKFEKYFKDNNTDNNLRYSLLSPTVVNWKGVGMYYDHDSVLKINDICQPDYKNLSKGYFSISNQDFFKDSEMYIYNSLKSVLKLSDGTEEDFFTFLTTTKLTDSINLFLTDGQKPIYTVGYYNKYVDNLSFIVYGIKFSLSFNTNQYVKELSLKEYNRYEIYIINDYTGEKDEVFINTIENVILIVMHNFNYHQFNFNHNIFYSSEGKLYSQEKYKWISTDKSVDINKSEVSGANVYIPFDQNTNIGETVECEKFVQLNYFNQKDFLYEKTDSNSLMFFNYHHLNEKYLHIDFNNFDERKILKNDSEALSLMWNQDFKFMPYQFYETKNWLINPYYTDGLSLNTEDMFDYMIKNFAESFRADNLKIYVKIPDGSDVSVNIIETSSQNLPIKVDYELPVNTKYLTDFYNPNFRSIVEFDLNETEQLMNDIKVNCLLGNTSVSKVSAIKNYYGFKVYEMKKDGFTDDLNMFVLPERSVISSNWDSGYYRIYKNGTFKNLDGFVPGIEDKAFFGGKGVVLKDVSVFVDEWSGNEIKASQASLLAYSTTSENQTHSKNLNVKINLTQTFCNNFNEVNISASTFRKNWTCFNSNTENAKNNFIKKSLVNYFKVNSKNNLRVYAIKKMGSQDILLKRPANFDDFVEVKNFESVYTKENDEIVLSMILPDTSKTYYITYEFSSNY